MQHGIDKLLMILASHFSAQGHERKLNPTLRLAFMALCGETPEGWRMHHR
jgi:hypothetical protein